MVKRRNKFTSPPSWKLLLIGLFLVLVSFCPATVLGEGNGKGNGGKSQLDDLKTKFASLVSLSSSSSLSNSDGSNQNKQPARQSNNNGEVGASTMPAVAITAMSARSNSPCEPNSCQGRLFSPADVDDSSSSSSSSSSASKTLNSKMKNKNNNDNDQPSSSSSSSSKSNENQQIFCWTEDDHINYCNNSEVASHFQPYANKLLSVIPCYGNATFTFLSSIYWLNGSVILVKSDVISGSGGGQTSSKWVRVDSSSDFLDKYGWFLSRLRPHEATGSFYCWSRVSRLSLFSGDDEIVQPYFYDGFNYFDLSTDSDGKVERRPQSLSQHKFFYFHYVAGDSNIGCKGPVCCWFNDDNTAEFVFNGTHWLVWSDSKSAYELYSGELSLGITDCAKFTVSQPSLIGGAVGPAKKPDRQSSSGDYYFLSPESGQGMFHNASGDWRCRIVNGVFQYQSTSTVLPTTDSSNNDCNDDDPGSAVFLSQSFDRFANNRRANTAVGSMKIDAGAKNKEKSSQNGNKQEQQQQKESPGFTACDPTSTLSDGGCGPGYTCVKLPQNFNISCSMGFCLSTELPKDCSSDNVLSAKVMSGEKCQQHSDCYTGRCRDGVCSCRNDDLKVLASFDFNWKINKLVYQERCIAKTERVVGLGETCRTKKDGRVASCSFGTSCMKCPQFAGNAFVKSTCVGVNPKNQQQQTNSLATSTSDDVCPESSNRRCRYLATCSMIGGVTPMCTCPQGYNLEPNGIDCYGWKQVEVGQCSATCDFGIQPIKRVCDKRTQSTIECDGSPTLIVPCQADAQCPLNSSLVSVSLLMRIFSKVLTVDLFESDVEPSLKQAMVEVLNTNCVSNEETYENECCPGRVWPGAGQVDGAITSTPTVLTPDCISNETGVAFMNKFSNGSMLSFYLMAFQGNAKSKCCQAGALSTSTASEKSTPSHRKKRSAVGNNVGAFDQETLASIMADPTMIAQISSTVQNVDPSATSFISKAEAVASQQSTTVAAATTAVVIMAPKFFYFDDGFPVWAAGVFGGVFAIAIIAAIVTLVVCISKKKAKLELKRKASALAQRQTLEARRPFTLNYDATHQPIDRDTCYPSYYTVYPAERVASSRLVPQSAHEAGQRTPQILSTDL